MELAKHLATSSTRQQLADKLNVHPVQIDMEVIGNPLYTIVHDTDSKNYAVSMAKRTYRKNTVRPHAEAKIFEPYLGESGVSLRHGHDAHKSIRSIG